MVADGPLGREGRSCPDAFCLICCWCCCIRLSCASSCSSICSCRGFRLARLLLNWSRSCSFCGDRYQLGTGCCAELLAQESGWLLAGLEALLLLAGLDWSSPWPIGPTCGGRAWPDPPPSELCWGLHACRHLMRCVSAVALEQALLRMALM